MNSTKRIDQILEELQERSAVSQKPKRSEFKGTVKDFLELIRDHPELAETPYERLFRAAFEEPGRKETKYEDDQKLFRSLGRSREEVVFLYNAFPEFYGSMIESIEEYADFLYQAKMGGEASRQAVWFVGPVGGAKSSFTDKLKSILENETMFVLGGCDDKDERCVMWDDPLRILPRHIREDLAKELGIYIPLKDDVCPNCRWRLNNEFENDYLRFPVEEVEFSVRHLVGIGTVTYVEAEEADISELVGGMDLAKLGEYTEDHPLVSRPSGICNKANGGILEFVEAPDMPASYLTPINTITQEGRLGTTGRQPQVSVRTNIILHSNEESFMRFFADEENKKIYDRIVPVYFPYNVRLDEEVKVYKKLIGFSKFKECHVAPYAIELISIFAILTRIKESQICENPLVKLQILNGDKVRFKDSTKEVTVADLRGEHGWDGMDGISPRFNAKVLDSTFSYNQRRGTNCIDPIGVFRVLCRKLRGDRLLMQNEERFKKYLLSAERALAVYKEQLKNDFAQTFFDIKEDYAESVFQKYLDNAELWTKSIAEKSGDRSHIDQGLLETIEKSLGIDNPGAAHNFRVSVVKFAEECKASGRPLHYDHHEKINIAIKKILMKDMKEFLRVPHEERLRNPEQERTHNDMIKALKKKGYCKHCASSTMNWYSINMS